MTAHYNSPVSLEQSINHWTEVLRTSRDPEELERATKHLKYYYERLDTSRQCDLQLSAIRTRIRASDFRNNVRVILLSPAYLAFFIWKSILFTLLWGFVVALGFGVLFAVFGGNL